MEERGEEIPSAVVKPVNSDKIMEEHRETMRKEEERINEIKKQYKEDNAEFLEAQQLLNDK